MTIDQERIINLYDIKDNKHAILSDEEGFYEFCRSNYDSTMSQSFQDIWVEYEAKEKFAITNGFYVDIGAYDGVNGSNTLNLEQMGWEGILVDPNPFIFDKCRSKRNNAWNTFDNRAVFDKTGEVLEFVLTGADSQLSTLKGFENSDYNADIRAKAQQIIMVETVTLNDLLDQNAAPADIDYISLDTEGTETIILEKFFTENKDKYTVNLWTVEHNYGPQRKVINRLMERNGYKRKFEEFSRWDDFYIREDWET